MPDPASRLPRPGVLASPHTWPELVGFYGPLPGLATNTRIWLQFGGEIEVFTRGPHLMMRSLAGTFRSPVELLPVDGGDPLAFQAKVGKQVVDVVFKRDRTGRICRLLPGIQIYGFYDMYKRPALRSTRFRLNVATNALAALAAVGIVLAALPKKRR
jgi:hypothetical protein